MNVIYGTILATCSDETRNLKLAGRGDEAIDVPFYFEHSFLLPRRRLYQHSILCILFPSFVHNKGETGNIYCSPSLNGRNNEEKRGEWKMRSCWLNHRWLGMGKYIKLLQVSMLTQKVTKLLRKRFKLIGSVGLTRKFLSFSSTIFIQKSQQQANKLKMYSL